MIDRELPQDIYCNAVLVLEGLTFYAPGKRKAAMAGAIEQLDAFISEQEKEFESDLNLQRVSVLECFSNIIGSRQVRQLELNGKLLMTQLKAGKAIFGALKATRNTKQARAVCSCLFNLLLDNI